MKPRKPIRKQSPRTAGSRAQDAKWQKDVVDRAGGVCEVVGCLTARQGVKGHHLLHKWTYGAARHDTGIGIALCWPHHRFAEDHPEEFDRMVQSFWPDRHAYAEAKRREINHAGRT